MKTKEEIEQLANDDIYSSDDMAFSGYIRGYTQCQEDNKNNLFIAKYLIASKLKIYLKELTDEGIIHPDVRDNIISYF
jgi:hypothetical protein